jgi:hypothetical protein
MTHLCEKSLTRQLEPDPLAVKFHNIDTDRCAQTNLSAAIPVYLIDKLGSGLALVVSDFAERFPHDRVEADACSDSFRPEGKTGANQTVM